MAEVSIIVPVYQVEKYIRQCVDSILAQTFTDFELILVDDGSMDKSGEICDQYAGMDERVKVIHQKNNGVAAARNAGIDCAIGDYLCFVDADDWIEKEMLARCIYNIKEVGADVLRHGHIVELWKEEKRVSVEEKSAPDFANMLMHDQIPEKMEAFWHNCSNYVWNYIFTKKAVGDVRFQKIKISEDHVFILEVLEQCENICFLAENTYHYCMRMGSSANRWQEEGIECQLKMIRSCHHFMNSFGITDDRKNRIMANMILNAYSYVIYLLCFPECKWSVKEKIEKSSKVRKELEVDTYIPFVELSGLPLSEKIKLQLICHRQERIMIWFGPVFMKVVRKANS